MVAPANLYSKKIDRYENNILSLLDADLRDFAERRLPRSQKKAAVEALKKSIEKMMYMNYTIREQVRLLTDNVPFFSMTNETYIKHVRTVLGDDILRMHKLNGILCYKLRKINNTRKMFSDTKEQFDYLHLDEIKVYENDYITFKDYELFLKVYENSLIAKNDTQREETSLEYSENSVHLQRTVHKSNIQKELEVYENIELSTKTENKKDSPLEEFKKVEIEEKLNNDENLAKDSVFTQSDIFGSGLVKENEDFKISTVQDDPYNITQRVKIEFDNGLIPGDLDEFARLSANGTDIAERYAYFHSLDTFQMSDYLPQHNELLFVKHDDVGVGIYRYDSRVNTLFYVKNFNDMHIGYSRTFEHWYKKHASDQFHKAVVRALTKRREDSKNKKD